ncbi:MAG: hypothetical protein APU95_00655 [Hadesarchaea archaeon YNP_N21]|jgi:hypothetical protein|nr:MAG: hypothetical protein APU95_00655 [Hadesarchaea archaeon YNP_N21]
MLSLASLNLTLRFGEAELPSWLGSAMRGGLGQHMRRIVCYRPMQECRACDLAGNCIYYEVYERPYAKRGHAPPPRPILLVPPFFGKKLTFRKEGRIEVGLLLFDRSVQKISHVILALQQFGSHGLGEGRYLGKNRFEVERATCKFSNQVVFDRGVIHPDRLKITDVAEIAPVTDRHLQVRFRTPIELPLGFPPPPDHLLKLIRQRLVMFVNEYGKGEKIPDFKCRGSVKPTAKHYHRLIGYSRRSGRREFWNCWTGIAEYDFEELDVTGQWLLGVGQVLGAGAKSSFGLGFFDIIPEKSTTLDQT